MAHPRHQEVRERYPRCCGYCGVSEIETGGELTIDHYQPVSAGGDDSDDNLVYTCFRDNTYRGHFWPTDADLKLGRRLLHPFLDQVSLHIRENPLSGWLEPLTATGRFHILLLRLNRPLLIGRRLARRLSQHHVLRGKFAMSLNREMQRNLLAGVLAEPNDDAPRLVYADWLEENGDPLAELIRVQVELSRDPIGPRKRSLQARESQFLNGFGFDRPARRASDDDGVETFPDWTYWIDRNNEGARVLGRGSGLKKLTDLRLSDCSLGDAGVEAIIRSPHLPLLNKLDLDRTNVRTAGVRALAETDRFFRTGSLSLWSCKLPDKALEPIACSPHAVLLEQLALAFNRFTDVGMRRLIESPYLKQLRRLRLGYNRIGPFGAALVSDPKAFPLLEEFDLDNNPLGDEGRLAIARWARARRRR